MIKCPSCSDQMEEKVSCGITIDQCSSCKGLWYDKDELVAFCIMSGFNKNKVENVLNHFEYLADNRESFCPRCESHKLNSTRIKWINVQVVKNARVFLSQMKKYSVC